MFLILAAAVAMTSAAMPTPPQSSMAALPQGQRTLLTLRGVGVQQYRCQADARQGFSWVLQGPLATLYDAHGTPVGRHYAGPHWALNDGSVVAGKLVQQWPQPSAVAWLRLAASDHQGRGQLDTVDEIRRLHTVGGLAPGHGCDAAHQGAQLDVPYQADYAFDTAAR